MSVRKTGFRLAGLMALLLGFAGYYAWRYNQVAAVKPQAESIASPNAKINQPFKPEPKPIIATASVQTGTEQVDVPELQQVDFSELLALPTKVLWGRWQLAFRHKDTDSTVLTAALIEKLRQGGGIKSILAQTARWLRDGSLSAEQQTELISLLGETSTPETLSVLTKLLQDSTDNGLRNRVADAIAQGSSGLSEWDLKSHPELSPILERLWQQLEPDQKVAEAVATRIAREGTPSGIKLMLDQIGQEGQTLNDIAQANNPSSLAALKAMSEVRNPEAVPLLKQTFQSQALDSAVFNASGNALAAVATVDATKTLLDWARLAPDNTADQVRQWLGTAAGNDPDATLFLKNALDQDAAFKSAEVKQAVSAVMQERE